MVWIGAGLAILLAATMAAFTATVLRRLPLPEGEPEARPYAELISPKLLATVLCCCLAALGLSFWLAAPATWPVWGALGTLGVLLAVIDAHTGFLPLRLTWALAALVLAAAAVTAWLKADAVVVVVAVLCGLGAWILFLLFWRIGGGIGFGDVRLVAIIAGAAGANSLNLAVWSLLLGGVAGVVWGVVARLARGSDGAFPYGPSLLIGPYAALAVQLLLTS
jgi:leader peptidase (prepilin peptidase)/N-methyltransferase